MASASTWAAFTPTQQELAYVQLLFNAADTQKLGIITGDAAVPVLAGSSLPPEKLGEIWAIADHDNNGFLTKKGVAAAVRLIAWAQVGEPVTEDLLSKSGPLPAINGIQGPGDPVRASSPNPRGATGASTLPPFTPADRSKFLRLFANGGPIGGLLSGDKARDIFLKSRLSVEKLSQIWNLADTQNRGALDANDFAIGMHLIQACMTSPSFILPTTLPPGFYEQVSGGTPKPLESQSTGGSVPRSPARGGFHGGTPPLKPQYTGERAPGLRTQATGTSVSALNMQATGGGHIGLPSPASSSFPSTQSSTFTMAQPPWDITREAKVKADGFFDSLDAQRRGYIEGDVAVPFMLESKLPESLLAQIWDLADINGDGKLTRDGFAVALHLINGKLGGKEIPPSLPLSLIPPSMRKGATSALRAGPQSQVQKDLLDLEDDMPLAVITSGAPSGTPKAVPLSPTSSGMTSVQRLVGAVAPVLPSPFGKDQANEITSRNTSHMTAAPSVAGTRRLPTRDLFDDDDIETAAAAAAANSIAAANTKNQLESTQRSLTTVQADRAKLDASVTESAGQLAALESQLASAKAQHQTETKLVADLQARQREQLASITQTRGELVTAESDLSALRAEKAEIEGSVLRDKEEIRDLQRKLKEVGEQTASTKSEVERLKRDARQHKGLLAIAKKQLTTAEENAEKARKEALAEQEELARVQEELDRTHAATEALTPTTKEVPSDRVTSEAPSSDQVTFPASVPLPETPEVQSPVIVTKSNNPFGRLTRQNSTASSTASPVPFKPFVLPTPLENGTETSDAEAAVLAPLPPSTDDVVKNNGFFDAAFGIEEPAEEHDTPQLVEAEAVTPSSNHNLSVAPPAAENPESFDVSSSDAAAPRADVSAPVSGALESVERHDNVHDPPQAHPQAEPQPVEIAGHQQGEDSSDDETAEPEDPFGSKPPRPNQASMPGAFENDVAHEPSLTSTPVAETSTEQETITQPPGQPTAPAFSATFDDAFGLNEPVPPAAPFSALPPPPSAKNGRSSPASKSPSTFDDSPFSPARFPALDDASRPAGTAELDAAFGGKPIMPDAITDESPKPIFKQSFDDAFDFGSAPTSNPPIATTSLTNGHATTATNEPSAWLSAVPRSDGVPTTAAVRQPAFSPPSSPPPPLTAEDNQHPFSIDDAFSTPREIPAFTTISPPAPAPVPVPSPVTAPSPGATPARNPLPDDQGGNRRRSISPPIQRTSRMSISPPPASKSSGKGQSTKDDGGSKSSKLSLHFPFGKNKNKNKDKGGAGSSKKSGIALPDSPNTDEHGSYRAPPPVASSQRPRGTSRRTPTTQDVIGSGEPDDDIAAVKTLVNMGFTRQQAVDALEQHSYDVPAALNKLLGTA